MSDTRLLKIAREVHQKRLAELEATSPLEDHIEECLRLGSIQFRRDCIRIINSRLQESGEESGASGC